MPLVHCPASSGAFTFNTDGRVIHAETTDEFNQWARSFEITPVALVMCHNHEVLFHFLDDRDVVAFKMRWL